MSATLTLPPGVSLCHLPSPFRLARGGELHGALLAFERIGPSDAPAIVVLGGISASAHVCAHPASPQRGWWEPVVGPGAPIDTRRQQVLAFDWLGGNGGSTGPGGGETLPFIDAADQAAALWALCDALRIERVAAIVGSSYGGMVALHAAAQAPHRTGRVIAIAAAHRSHPQASAWRAVQRSIVEFGVRHDSEEQALALARSLALIGYRTPGELHDRFAGAPSIDGSGDVQLPVQDWLRARGAAFARRWNAAQFLCLNRSIDAHCIAPERILAPTALLAFRGDQLVPAEDVRALAAALPHRLLHREVPSRYGHDAFLKEPDLVGAFLREVLA